MVLNTLNGIELKDDEKALNLVVRCLHTHTLDQYHCNTTYTLNTYQYNGKYTGTVQQVIIVNAIPPKKAYDNPQRLVVHIIKKLVHAEGYVKHYGISIHRFN
eukprot:GHVR01190772.1.p2 GENE.GHVR01190772.1~~GHVR01190772.1.p2  ORF type:complete len:102 (+),score=7.13 GHVR01190772.1:152-457(+)